MEYSEDMFKIAYLFIKHTYLIGMKERRVFKSYIEEYNKSSSSYELSFNEIKTEMKEEIKECKGVRKCIDSKIKEFVDCSSDNEKRTLIWLLINIAYANKECDIREKVALEHIYDKLQENEEEEESAIDIDENDSFLCKVKWFFNFIIMSIKKKMKKVDRSILYELMDCALTLLIIDKKRSLIKGDVNEVDMSKEYKRESKVIIESIEMLINT